MLERTAELDQGVPAKDGIAFLVAHGASLSTAALEQGWDKAVDWQLPLQ